MDRCTLWSVAVAEQSFSILGTGGARAQCIWKSFKTTKLFSSKLPVLILVRTYSWMRQCRGSHSGGRTPQQGTVSLPRGRGWNKWMKRNVCGPTRGKNWLFEGYIQHLCKNQVKKKMCVLFCCSLFVFWDRVQKCSYEPKGGQTTG